MTTGSRGVHVVISLRCKKDFDAIRAVAKSIAEHIAHEHPDRVTMVAHIKDPGNKIYIDVLRNAYAQTGVAPYSVRARPHAPVATPIAWEVLFDGIIKTSDQFTIKTVKKHIEKYDPWEHFFKVRNHVDYLM